MLRRLLFLLVLLILLSMPMMVLAKDSMPEEVADFLATRQVISVVYFDLNSSRLGKVARTELQQIAKSLGELDPSMYIVRIEGFTSPEGNEKSNIALSMERAMEVEKYMAQLAGLSELRTLIGIGTDQDSELPNSKQRRVEIARYDKRLSFDSSQTEKLLLNY